MKYLFIFLLLTITFSFLSAQSKYEQDFVLMARKSSKKMPGMFTNGANVKVFLESGEKVSGQMLIYTDYIDVEGIIIYLDEIIAIKRHTGAFYKGLASSLAFTELLGRGFIANGTEGLGLRAGVSIGFSVLSVNRVERRFQRKKGWTYELVDMSERLAGFRRNR